VIRRLKTCTRSRPHSYATDRIDLLRCLIIGPAGTPYEDAPFLFDFFLPPSKYPSEPPQVFFHSWTSSSSRINPNLYTVGFLVRTKRVRAYCVSGKGRKSVPQSTEHLAGGEDRGTSCSMETSIRTSHWSSVVDADTILGISGASVDTRTSASKGTVCSFTCHVAMLDRMCTDGFSNLVLRSNATRLKDLNPPHCTRSVPMFSPVILCVAHSTSNSRSKAVSPKPSLTCTWGHRISWHTLLAKHEI